MRNAILRTAAKATAAGVVSFLGSVAAGYAVDGVMVDAEWWAAASVAVATAYATWQTPNRPAVDHEARHSGL
jgi:hypothetical protein